MISSSTFFSRTAKQLTAAKAKKSRVAAHVLHGRTSRQISTAVKSSRKLISIISTPQRNIHLLDVSTALKFQKAEQINRWSRWTPLTLNSLPARFFSTETQPKPQKQLTMTQKLKRFGRKYGRVGLYTYLAVSAVDFAAFYLLISAGVDVENIMIWIGLEQSHVRAWASRKSAATTASTLAIAYAVHKLFMPIRIAITASILPFIVKKLNIQIPETVEDDDDDDEAKKPTQASKN